MSEVASLAPALDQETRVGGGVGVTTRQGGVTQGAAVNMRTVNMFFVLTQLSGYLYRHQRNI